MNDPPAASSGSSSVAAAQGQKTSWSWRSYILWTAVGVVVTGAIVVIVLCVKGHGGGNTKPHPSSELQIAIIDRRPRGDDRHYQFTVLPNGLQVVNVQDETSRTSAYSMAVKAGSFDDPLELPGLAHFCEHMLFLGTQSYPDPASYDNFVNSNGGYLNAYTAEETTVYYTELSSSASGEGLTRFADFFRAPLFAEEYVEREVHAIDSEHAKNVQDPSWRVMNIMNSLANEASPVGAFHTGNIETLFDTPKKKGIDPVVSLRHWFKDHYCPSRYSLVTFGPEPVGKQLERVYEDFSDIDKGSDSCRGERRSWSSPTAWLQGNLTRWVIIQGMQPQSELLIFFPLPDTSKDYLSQPLQYIEYAITYGGEKSFVKTLRDTLGLATGIGVSAGSNSAGTSVYFSCRLTEAGREHPGLVLDLLFQYLHLLRSEGIDQDLYFSLANVTRISWDWAQAKGPSDTASDLAERMTRLPAARLLSGDDIIEEPNRDLVRSLLNKLTPDRMNVGLVDPDAQKKLFGQREVLVAPFYGTKYVQTTVNEQAPGALQRWAAWEGKNASEVEEEVQARLVAINVTSSVVPVPPKPISGLSAELSLDNMRAGKVKNDSDRDQRLFGPRPSHIEDAQEELEGDDSVIKKWRKTAARHQNHNWMVHPVKKGPSEREAWYRAGWVNPSPKAQMKFLLRPRVHPDDINEVMEVDAVSALRLGFYSSLLSEELVPKLFDLSVAGASFDIGLGTQGVGGTLSLAFEGFLPLLPSLIQVAVKEFDKGVKLEDHLPRYERIYQEYEESFRDYSSMPVDYAITDRNLLLTPGTHSQEESLAALVNVTPDAVESAPDQLVKNRPLDLTALIMGNIGMTEAEDSVDWVMEGLSGVQSTTGSIEGNLHHLPPVVKPANPIELRKRNPREGDTNDAVVVTLLAGIATVESRVVLGLIGQILSVLAYNDLRTERQLGYVVNSGVGQISNVQYVSTIVQGETARADEMEVAIERVYFKLMPERLRNLTQEEFQTYKDSFRQQLLQPPTGQSEEFGHYWSHILNGGKCFGLLNEMLEFMDQNLTSKSALTEAWAKVASPRKHENRRKVVVKYFADEVLPRPDVSDMNTMWSKAGFGMEILERLTMEYEATQVLDAANSTVRKSIVKDGGHYATTLFCTRRREKPEGDSSKETSGTGESHSDGDHSSQLQVRASRERRASRGSPSRPANADVQESSVRGHRGGRHFLEPES